jgi:ribosomal-protein-alanine N-acetyltransferase
MKYNFVPMTNKFARTMIAAWKYDDQYAIYDYDLKAAHILNAKKWGQGVFAVLDQQGELVGELTTEFFDQNGDYIAYNDLSAAKLRDAEMWIGFGLKPQLTGQGLGAGFVTACVEFSLERYGYQGKYVKLGVAAFNQRAIKVYERVGFRVFQRAVGKIGGQELPVLRMRKRI